MKYTVKQARVFPVVRLRRVNVGLTLGLALGLQFGIAVAQPTSPSPDANTEGPSDSKTGQQPTRPDAPSAELSPTNDPLKSNAPASNVNPTPPSNTPPVAEISYAEPEPEPPPPPSRFLSRSAFAIQLELGAGAPFGDIIDEEERATSVQGTYSDGTIQNGTISHNVLHVGVNAEFAPLKGRNARLAFRAGYLYTSLGQEAKVGGGNYETKTETAQLLRSHAALVGPVLYLGKRWFGSLQFMLGPVSGTIRPYPLASQAQLVTASDVGFNGWMLRVGPGFGYAFERFVLGGDLLYSYSSISFHDGVTLDNAKTSGLNAVAANFHAGVHF